MDTLFPPTAHSRASTDFGPDGLRQSMRLLDAAGIAHAGGGRDLKEARAPGIFASPPGKIAPVSAASTFKEYARANDAFGGLNARAGRSEEHTSELQSLMRTSHPGLFFKKKKK